jgi:hypothetical protein
MKSFVAALTFVSANALFSNGGKFYNDKFSNYAGKQSNGFSSFTLELDGVNKELYLAAPFSMAGGKDI